MALFDFLKRKKEVAKSKEKSTVKVQKKPQEKREIALGAKEIKGKKTQAKKTDISGFSYEMVKEPHISEKANYLAEKNKYVFKVYQGTNKPEIKRSIEGIYGVNVLSVNIIKIPPKKRRIGKTEGYKKGYAKAIVTIKKGQKIDIY